MFFLLLENLIHPFLPQDLLSSTIQVHFIPAHLYKAS